MANKKITITRQGQGPAGGGAKDQRAAVSALGKLAGDAVHGMSSSVLGQNRRVTDEIRSAVAAAAQKVRRGSGGDVTEFFSALSMGEAEGQTGGPVRGRGPVIKTVKDQNGKVRRLINIQDMIEHSAESGLNDLLLNETGRVEAYYDYLRIMDMIPQMANAVSTYTDNIMSPDDFTKESLDADYDDSSLQGDRAAVVHRRIEALLKKYRVDERAQKIISQSLIKGDYFMAVIPLREELSRLLSEGGEVPDQYDGRNSSLYSQRRLEESAHFAAMVERFVDKADVVLAEEAEGDDKEKPRKTKEERVREVKLEEKRLLTEAASDVARLVNENVLISKGTHALLAERAELSTAFEDVLRRRSEQVSRAMGGDAGLAEKPSGSDPVDVVGSAIRVLEAERCIKIEDGGICFGYVYFEQIPDHATDPDNIVINTTGSAYYSQNAGLAKILGSEKERLNAARRQFVYNMFVRGIADRLDRKVLAKNKQFADVIYHMLRQQSIVRRQIRITYIPPDQMVHFGNDDADQVYHDSLFKNVLFTAKLYIAMLTSSLMHRLVRAPSKRIFYIEVGLENDDGAAVSSFIRDLKSKEVGFDDITGGGIDNVLATIGTFNDIFCPVINGEKPIDVETIEENSPSMQDDFMEWLMKALTSGVGIPYAFIADSENVQFARSLTMENAKFLRAVVRLQRKYGKQFSQLLQILWRNEYDLGDPVEKGPGEVLPPSELEQEEPRADAAGAAIGDEEDIRIVVEKLRVTFPSPASLNTTNTNDQISASQPIIDFVAQIMCGPEGENDSDLLARSMKLEVAKKYVRLVDWDEMLDLYKEARKNMVRLRLSAPDVPEEGGAAGGGMMTPTAAPGGGGFGAEAEAPPEGGEAPPEGGGPEMGSAL